MNNFLFKKVTKFKFEMSMINKYLKKKLNKEREKEEKKKNKLIHKHCRFLKINLNLYYYIIFTLVPRYIRIQMNNDSSLFLVQQL